MEAKELMVDNLVYYKEKIVKVPRIDWQFSNNVYTPIKINKEYLQRMGFAEIFYYGNGFHSCLQINQIGIYVTIEDEKTKVTLTTGERSFVLDYKYIHQFQNLHYALCGKELVLKD